jgi:hypothetical protein
MTRNNTKKSKMADESTPVKRDSVSAEISDGGSKELIGIMARIREDQAFALELMENSQIDKTGGSDRDALIREALDMLIKERIKVLDLRGKHFLKTGAR